MSIRVFDFLCPHGHRIERFVDENTDIEVCDVRGCGSLGVRQIAAPRAKLEPFSGSFPGAADKWVRDRESKMKQERKNVENHNSYN